MPRVIQIRGVPDDVHAALSEAAASRGVSLNRYLRLEVEQIARRRWLVSENAAVVLRTQARVGAHLDRETILTAIREGRDE